MMILSAMPHLTLSMLNRVLMLSYFEFGQVAFLPDRSESFLKRPLGGGMSMQVKLIGNVCKRIFRLI